jgi:5'-methylthioadenosine phosphorylase
MEKVSIGVIGGSGLYQMEGLESLQPRDIETPFGKPSDSLFVGTLEGRRVAFLPRHGRGHRISPSEINYRANIMAMKMIGVEWIISVSAVGSMKEHIKPGHMVIPDQFVDRTVSRPRSFFGDGVVGHIAFADPVCPTLAGILIGACEKTGAVVHRGGAYICIEGPQFSTRAESLIFRSWGVDVIGMTNLPEARLAREAEIHYASLAMATDYDCWHTAEEDVTIDQILRVLMENTKKAQAILTAAVKAIPPSVGCGCGEAAKMAVVTDRALIPEETARRLQPILGKYWGA